MFSFKQICTALLLSIFIIPIAYSQPVETNKQSQIQPKKGQDYAMLIRNMNHLDASLKTVKMINEDDSKTLNHFEVVICGKGVTQLNDNVDLIRNAIHAGITLSACGMSLNNFSITEDELPKGVGVVQNGLIRMFDLMEKGYKTITL